MFRVLLSRYSFVYLFCSPVGAQLRLLIADIMGVNEIRQGFYYFVVIFDQVCSLLGLTAVLFLICISLANE